MAWLNFMHVKSKNEGKIKTFETNKYRDNLSPAEKHFKKY